MTEFELKLEVPPERLQPLAAALRQGPARRERLRATYFDTPDGALARHGIVVRMRQEGRKWVQTAKAPGRGPLERQEHNAPVAPDAAAMIPAVDLARHAGTPAGQAIRRALRLKPQAAFPPLVALYETDVTRLSVTVARGASQIELALDEGRIVAGAHSVPVRELELELQQGAPADVVQLAREGCALHGLWLSTISKSAKGQRLAGTTARPVATVQPPAVGPRAGGQELVAAVLSSCLGQVLEYASEVAGGSTDAEHIHQLRVGIRRLRTALRELAGLAQGIDPGWEAPLVAAFRVLGRHRDQGHLARTVEPLMEGAGGPAVAPQALQPQVPDPGAAVRAPAFQDALLGLLAFVHGGAAGAGPDHDATRKRVRKALAGLHARVLKDGRRFASLDEARQHRARKRAKRLRYLAEFAAPLFAPARSQAFADRLKPVQDALGLYNDELMALHAYRSLAATEPRAWFAAGWLSARREPNAQACQRAIQDFGRARPFWD
ncbi:CHAD domain-containing protein [Caenimonas terrae]|uniref:CHAD domain-containing protein n=1 Tax=Caenimonas terrae TaxID=696074 RepID=A0ABW0NC80_9BURK